MTEDVASKRLEGLRRQVEAEVRSRTSLAKGAPRTASARLGAAGIAVRVAMVAAVIALPFLVYVRASVLFHGWIGGAPWIAVAGALALTAGLVALYATWLMRRMVSAPRAATLARWVAVPVAAAFLLYSLTFLARVNAKTDGVRDYYRSLHPVLRVAVSTAIIVDPGAVITDLQRAPEDYGRMGLPVNQRTRHYVQSDGWVHAVDLRTIGRGEIRNRLLQFYFWSMGFSTLRHTGTADHLHVQLRG